MEQMKVEQDWKYGTDESRANDAIDLHHTHYPSHSSYNMKVSSFVKMIFQPLQNKLKL